MISYYIDIIGSQVHGDSLNKLYSIIINELIKLNHERTVYFIREIRAIVICYESETIHEPDEGPSRLFNFKTNTILDDIHFFNNKHEENRVNVVERDGITLYINGNSKYLQEVFNKSEHLEDVKKWMYRSINKLTKVQNSLSD